MAQRLPQAAILFRVLPLMCPLLQLMAVLQKSVMARIRRAVIGNKHASGTEIIAELGEEHQKTGKPIVYTSADSVFQIATHEESFGLDRLYEICLIARELVDEFNVGR